MNATRTRTVYAVMGARHGFTVPALPWHHRCWWNSPKASKAHSTVQNAHWTPKEGQYIQYLFYYNNSLSPLMVI